MRITDICNQGHGTVAGSYGDQHNATSKHSLK